MCFQKQWSRAPEDANRRAEAGLGQNLRSKRQWWGNTAAVVSM